MHTKYIAEKQDLTYITKDLEITKKNSQRCSFLLSCVDMSGRGSRI